MGEGWSTPEQVGAGRERLERELGWQRPLVHAIALDSDETISFRRVNIDEGYLPAVILATVLGHVSGSASYRLPASDLNRAITMLAPAEACTELEHPNLAVWRQVCAEVGSDGYAVIVFLEALDQPSADPHVRALLNVLHEGKQHNDSGTMTLWRPVGPAELKLLRENGFTAWPPRLADQPIFYPVLNEDYAITIARDWNVPASGVGYVTEFEVDTAYALRHPTRRAGGGQILELWIPAAEIDEFNSHLIGPIRVSHEFGADPS